MVLAIFWKLKELPASSTIVLIPSKYEHGIKALPSEIIVFSEAILFIS